MNFWFSTRWFFGCGGDDHAARRSIFGDHHYGISPHISLIKEEL